jgi:hypothetical protein
MAKNVALTLLLLCGLILLGYQGSTLLAAPPQQATTATPAPTEEPLEEAEVEATEALTETVAVAAEPTLAELEARVDRLQAQVDALRLRAGLANEVTTAVYLLDNAGLHGLDERLNNEGVIQPGDAGRVARIARVLSSVDWPPALAEDAAALTDTLHQLASALREDDLETAASLATVAHEDQHAFSHEAEHWLSEVTVLTGEHATAGQAFRVTSAVYLLDNADLHGLDERLNNEGVIEPADAGRVARIARLLSSVDWPPALAEDAAALTDTLNQLASALREDDLEAAAPLATIAHEDQHAFSHEAEHWLGELTGDHGDGDAHGEEDGDDHGDEEEEAAENSGG